MPTEAKIAIVLLAIICATHPARATEQVHLNGKAFTVPDGFTVELAAAPPLVDRPIEADFDELGRLYVSDSSGSNDDPQKQLTNGTHRILRLSCSHGDGVFDQRTIFADRLTFPEGVLWLGDSLYVAGVPSIWKLTDSRGPASGGAGVADRRTEWFKGNTITHCANDLHGPYSGPDGWIYWCKGAFAEQTHEHAGLPSRGAGGVRKPLVTRASHIFRARPDGSGIEPVMTGGMDNPVEVAFTAGGERIVTATFLQGPAGGRRDGLIHAVYGGVYGKAHDVLDSQPRTSPDLLPVLSHLGPAACCGLARYESDAFGPEYQYPENLFVACFNLRKVTRHELIAIGATFESRDSDFLTCDSLDFHPTDVLEDADGSLLVIDTGGWYKLCCPTSQLGKPDVLGAIYRVRRKGAVPPPDPRGLKLPWSSMSDGDLAGLLGAPAIRKRAISALAARGASAVPDIRGVLESVTEGTSDGLDAVWAATRIDDPSARAAVRLALKDRSKIVRQAAAHSVSVWRDREAAPLLLEMLRGDTPLNRRVAAEALGRLGDAGAVPAILGAIARADPADRVMAHSLTYALMEIDDPASVAAGLTDASPAVRRSAMVALDQMDGGTLTAGPVAEALTSPDAQLRESAAWIAGRHPEWAGSFVSVMAQQWTSANLTPDDRLRLVHQSAEMARSPVVQDWLAAKASDAAGPAVQRRLALQAMAQANLKPPPEAWAKAVTGALAGGDADVLLDAISAAGAFPRGKEKGPERSPIDTALAAIGGRAELPAALRLKAMSEVAGGLPDVSADLFAFLRSQLAPENPVDHRLPAAAVIGKAKLTEAQLESVAECIASAGPLELDPLLVAFKETRDAGIGRKLVLSLKESKTVKSPRPDLLRRRLAGFGPEVQKEAEALYAQLNPDAAKIKARLDELLASLPPGDVRRGQAVFNGNRASCVACHAIGYVGGDVGPDLTRIGQTRAERDLLESIVFPSASFVQSFEPVQIDTVDGDRLYGIVRGNNAEEIVVVTGPNQNIRVPQKDIREMRPGTVSIMPAGFDQTLSPRELADVVAFLRACK